MAEYYALLTRAVAGLEFSTPESRRAIYDKARHALIVQLKAINPPLTPSEISRQRLELEEAIRKVERESASGGPPAARAEAASVAAARGIEAALGNPPPRAEPRRPAIELAKDAPRSMPAAEKQPASGPEAVAGPHDAAPDEDEAGAWPAETPVAMPRGEERRRLPLETPRLPPDPEMTSLPQAVFRRAIQEAEQQGRGPAGPAAPAPSEPAFADRPTARDRAAEPPIVEPSLRAEPSVRAEPPRRGAAEMPRAEGRSRDTEPTLAVRPPAIDDDEPPPLRPAAQRNAPVVAGPRWEEEPEDDLDDAVDPPGGGRGRTFAGVHGPDDDYEAPPRRSRLSGLIIGLLVLVLLGGVGALAWTQRNTIMDLVASFDGPEQSAEGSSPPPRVTEAPTETADAKDSARLLSTPEAAPDSSVRVVGGDEVAPVGGPPPESDPAADGPGDPPAAAEEDAPELGDRGFEAPTEPDQSEADVAALEPAPSAPEEPADEPVVAAAQKAILYEEPMGADAGASVQKTEGSVTWSYLPGGSDGPVIEATIEVPEKSLKISLKMRRNTDAALPASHMIEIVVNAPAGFGGGGVKQIPRLVLKPTEEARGQPLVGEAVPVTDGFFWIALSKDGGAENSNLALIRERGWIDLPLLYANGQRAILTFEKGTAGEAAVDQALAAWNN